MFYEKGDYIVDIKTIEPQKIVSLTIRNNIKLLPLTCNYVKSLVEGIGMTKEQVETIAFSTEYVLKRRILNAYKGIGEITLNILVSIDKIWIEIADKGVPYWVDDNEIQQRISKLPVEMRTCHLKKLGTEGQCFSMCFNIAPDIDITAFKKQDDIEEELLDTNLNIRPTKATEKDINEVVKCIYSNYGYGYQFHKIYDLEQMKAIINEGKRWSYFGINDHEQIMAHISLAFSDDFPNIPELGGLVCKPYCRGHNVASRMVKAVCDYSQDKGINGIYAEPVAFHPISQKMLNRNNFIPTGLKLHYLVPESAGTYADGDRRMDVFVCAKLFDTDKVRKICVPDDHRDFISDTYKKLGVECEFISQSKPTDDGEFIMRLDREVCVGQIIVDKTPANFENDLSGFMKEFSKNGIMMVEANINMNDSGAVTAYEKFKEQGFIFGGILPGSDKGEYMIMMNLMDIPVEWDKLVAIEGYDEILSYIKNQ